MATGQYTQFPIDWKTIDASQVPYSNTSSGLTAADVQNAIDEVSSLVYELQKSGIYVVKVQSNTGEVTHNGVAITKDELSEIQKTHLVIILDYSITPLPIGIYYPVSGYTSPFKYRYIVLSSTEPYTPIEYTLSLTWNNTTSTWSVSKANHAYVPIKSFTVTLASASWSGNELTVSNADFIASGYAYIVTASPDDTLDWQDANVYAEDVTTDGSMTFVCDTEPTSDLTANILRVKVQ